MIDDVCTYKHIYMDDVGGDQATVSQPPWRNILRGGTTFSHAWLTPQWGSADLFVFVICVTRRSSNLEKG